MNTSKIKSEKIRWILDEAQRLIGAAGESIYLHIFREQLAKEVRPKLEAMPEETLRRIGSYGINEAGECEWEEFWRMTSLAKAGLDVRGGKSGKQLLEEVALTVVVAIAWDIRHQENYRDMDRRQRNLHDPSTGFWRPRYALE